MKKNGFTLVEIIVSIMIMAVIAVTVGTVFNSWNKGFYEENSRLVLERDTRDVMDNIMTDLRRYAVTSTVVTSNPTRLTISSTVVYQYDGTSQLMRNGIPVLDEEDGTTVTAFSVTPVTPGSQPTDEFLPDTILDISLTLTVNKGSTNLTYTLNNTFRKKLY